MDASRLSPGVKRDHDGRPVRSELTPDSSKMHIMPADVRSPKRAASPALSTASSSLSELSSVASQSQQPTNPSGSPSKKRKLTFEEKQVEAAVKKREKEERARLKIEAKERKEEEKRRKAEEKEASKREKEIDKARKDAEKAAEKAKRDAAKREKEDEKNAKEAEKLKKERAQMRIGTFFGRPANVESTPPSTPDDVSSGVSSRRSSVASVDMPAPLLASKPESAPSEYLKWILPFFTPDHTDVAPHNRFLASGSSSPRYSDLPTQYPNATTQPLNHQFGRSKRKIRHIMPVKTLINLIGGSEQAPIDLTGEPTLDEASYLLSKTPYKILSFREDIRPPYQGTFTRPVSPRSKKRLSRKSTSRALPNTDYDYDSEAEWQAPEEGDEDLEDDDELSEDEADAEEMEDFLDDENDTSKRKLVNVDVEPESTGLCWEGETDLNGLGIDINAYRIDVLHDDTRFPIDPYSAEHWSMTGKVTPSKPKPIPAAETTAMQPPRMPLSTLHVPNGTPLRTFVTTIGTDGADQKENAAPLPQKPKAKNAHKPIKKIPDDILPAFKAAISGSDLNKVALVEILKKQFPSCPKDAIKGTLETVAVRQGKKEVDKRWVLVA